MHNTHKILAAEFENFSTYNATVAKFVENLCMFFYIYCSTIYIQKL